CGTLAGIASKCWNDAVRPGECHDPGLRAVANPGFAVAPPRPALEAGRLPAGATGCGVPAGTGTNVDRTRRNAAARLPRSNAGALVSDPPCLADPVPVTVPALSAAAHAVSGRRAAGGDAGCEGRHHSYTRPGAADIGPPE